MGNVKRREESGSILILTVWIIAMLAMLSASLAYRTRIDLRLSESQWDQQRLAESARSTVFQMGRKWQQSNVQATGLNQTWNQDPDVVLEDESAKLSLNKASGDALTRLFGAHSAVVPAILAWRQDARGDEAYSPLGYTSRRGGFKSVEELLLVRGMTPEIFHQVAPFLTVYTGGAVNFNTASEQVLSALGVPPAAVLMITQYRAGIDAQEGTADDRLFKSAGELVSFLKQNGLRDDPAGALAALIQKNLLTVQSDTLHFSLRARLTDSRASRRFNIIAAARTTPVRILSWRETY